MTGRIALLTDDFFKKSVHLGVGGWGVYQPT